jgi:AcrR family transcriptional regulator
MTESAVDPHRRGRPRSEEARQAVLEAVDDLLAEEGYAAMTMRGIAERAGVGRQTVYRWWSTKAEILLEACVSDAREQLHSRPRAEPRRDLVSYLSSLTAFLSEDDAGLAFRALVGEAQHDETVRDLVAQADVLSPSAHEVLARVRPKLPAMPATALATDQLIGPVLSRVLLRHTPPSTRELTALADALIRAWQPLPAP